MAGAQLLATGICCFQKSCFTTLQLSKLWKLPENWEHTKHISKIKLLVLVPQPMQHLSLHKESQEFQGSTSIQKLYS